MSTGKPDVKQDPQRSRDLGHLSFRGAFEALPPDSRHIAVSQQTTFRASC
jgi:hypothetical protein